MKGTIILLLLTAFGLHFLYSQEISITKPNSIQGELSGSLVFIDNNHAAIIPILDIIDGNLTYSLGYSRSLSEKSEISLAFTGHIGVEGPIGSPQNEMDTIYSIGMNAQYRYYFNSERLLLCPFVGLGLFGSFADSSNGPYRSISPEYTYSGQIQSMAGLEYWIMEVFRIGVSVILSAGYTHVQEHNDHFQNIWDINLIFSDPSIGFAFRF